MNETKNQKYVWGAVILAVVIIIAGFILTGKTSAPAVGQYDDFAKCLAEKNLTMYGAAWCSHCQNEKSHFGSSFQYVPYVECPDNTALCDEKGITGFPTWIDKDGKKYEGEQGLEKLSQISGCPLPVGK
jgi:hypothetical protein